MRKNALKEILIRSKEIAYCGWLHIPNSWSAEIMAHVGWDAITVDMQHGLMDMGTAVQMLQAIATTDTVPLARVNWNDPGDIMRLLDSGAYGIICPMINTKEQCEAFVKACKYPPEGYRSFGPTRARVYAGMDYGDHANDEILTIAMVETSEAVDNIAEICGVKGLDMVFVGSGDLRLSLTGNVKKTMDDGAFEKALSTILKTCGEHKVAAGIWVPTVAAAGGMKERGFQFIALKSDSMMLAEFASKEYKSLKTSLE